MEGIVHTILRIGIIRALNESAGRLFRAATQHRKNNCDSDVIFCLQMLSKHDN